MDVLGDAALTADAKTKKLYVPVESPLSVTQPLEESFAEISLPQALGLTGTHLLSPYHHTGKGAKTVLAFATALVGTVAAAVLQEPVGCVGRPSLSLPLLELDIVAEVICTLIALCTLLVVLLAEVEGEKAGRHFLMIEEEPLCVPCASPVSFELHSSTKAQEVQAWAALEPGAPLVPHSFELAGKPPPGHVDIAVRFCGICGSDVHQIEDAWGVASFPLVAGHEIVGEVVAVGDGVTRFAQGDIAAIGVQRSCCGSCVHCDAGDENVCPAITKTYAGPNKDRGGFATMIRYPAGWVFAVPAGLAPESVGPLMCAGITTYSPLKRHATRGDRVGIVGIGGLGHLALQFGRAMGLEVYALSRTADKEAEARGFGASGFVNTEDATQLAALAGSFDVILLTASGRAPLDPYLALLKPRGKLVCVSLPDKEERSQLYLHSAVIFERALVGSYLGPHADYAEMLEMARDHGVRPQVELAPMSQINAMLERVRAGKARYRVVLQM